MHNSASANCFQPAIVVLLCTVSHFTRVFSSIVDRDFSTQLAFAHKAKLPQNQVNQYYNGVRPRLEQMRKVLAAMKNVDDRKALMVAWVQDTIPEEWRSQITVAAN